MGDERETIRVRASGAPTRCPFCHDDVDHDREEWVACRGCLARHHAACWDEGKGCAGCGDEREIHVPAPSETRGLPTLEVALHVRREHEAGVDANVPVLVGIRDEPFAVLVKNHTGAPQRVELRRLPPWLRVEGPAALDVAMGGEATFRLAVVADAAPRVGGVTLSSVLTRKPLDEERAAVTGAFVVSTPVEARTVGVTVYRETSRRTLIGVGIFCGLSPWPPGIVALTLTIYVLVAKWPGPETTEVDAAFRRRLAVTDRRAAKTVLVALLASLACVIAAISRL